MKCFRPDVNGLRAAIELARESDALAARLRISLTSTSSEGLIIEALMGGYLKKTKRQLIICLILFSMKTAFQRFFGFGFKALWKNRSKKIKLKRLDI